MAWTSFNNNLNEIVEALSGDTDLNNYCVQMWGKGLTVTREFRNKTDVHLSNLPICMITRPEMIPIWEMASSLYRKHTVRVYIGFQENLRNQAQETLIGLEELVEQALLKEGIFSPEIYIEPGKSINDEGSRHPVYFLIKDIDVFTERDV